MDQEASPPNEKESSKFIRITTSGKIKPWVTHSLTFLEEEEGERSITFHTFPASVDSSAAFKPETGKLTGVKMNHKSASSTTAMIPRLITVVEIVKREYLKLLQENRSSRMKGLHQYNEIGTLEQLGASVIPEGEDGKEVSAEEVRSLKIIEAVSGRNHTRQIQSPFMRVTLSTVERPDLLERGATYQPPTTRKLSKSAKLRAKRQAKKQQEANEQENEQTSAAAVPAG